MRAWKEPQLFVRDVSANGTGLQTPGVKGPGCVDHVRSISTDVRQV